ncbi:MAG: transposase [Sedimentitalea sp.]|uniref:transposase n=1 Tax=Sedimentitalea sp. TaxID=2048915 RepID=UPI003267E00A
MWSAPRRTTCGGQPHYSDLAIEMCLTLGLVFKQPLHQTQGLMRSLARLLGVEIAVPDFSTLSRRGNGLTLRTKPRSKSDKPVQLVVDSTGLKVIGLRRSIKTGRSVRIGASSTSVLILSVARSFAPI